MSEPLIFERGAPGRKGYSLPVADIPKQEQNELLPEKFRRKEKPRLPEVSEVEVVRHYTRLSQLNYGVDSGIYPLGTCTMKYNPKLHEDLVRLEGFQDLHPYLPEELAQGALQLLHELAGYLAEIGGMDRISLQPAAGAHGELTGLMIAQAYHTDRGQERSRVIVPDSAHGTNPASAAVCGYEVVEVESSERGLVSIDELKQVIADDVAAVMLTNPNTLGLFEEEITEIARIVHDSGALLYCDGANMNAIMGITRPGDMGFDLIHFNLHKTFSTPHGGGGPGSGPLGVKEFLAPFLPIPRIVCSEDGHYGLDYDHEQAIGRIRTFYGNFGVLLKAYAYIRSLGPEGLRQVSEDALLNANYMMHRLKDHYELPHEPPCMHEFVLSGSRQKQEYNVSTMEIAKRLLDHGHYAPTVYFPLIVKEALMIEPTETENRESLDDFIDSMITITEEIASDPDYVRRAPHTTSVRRLDEARASRKPDLRWHPGEEDE